jgi:hypothetical membrane protein
MIVSVKKFGAWAGLLSAVGIMISFLIVAIAYRGRIGQHYSPINHVVSELGEVGISRLAWFFNGSLIVGGIGILLGLISLALHLRGWFRYFILVLGFVTGLAGTFVGIFPMNQIYPHLSAALTFFNTGWIVTGAFSLYLLFARQKQFPRWLAFPGFVTAIAFVVFMRYSGNLMEGSQSVDEILGAARPAVWSTAIVEWVVVLTILVWIASVCAVIIRLDRQEITEAGNLAD